ncbi:head GIN domain-containing protein [Sandarakinorhabdus oryzae]|uniref:head GIN domain-containing protein n=1 Tax=Sandarakinorhabdus oryzae TaxID=2675220 RepID=UPI0012E148A6|nr:head GIN domain-containing protein [Sandarakinorhabdus oryzae]
MTRPALLLLSAALVAAPASAAERRFEATGFDRVAVSGSDNVRIQQGKGFAVVANGEAADLDKLDIRVEKGALLIGRKKGNWSWGNGKEVTVAVTLPALHGLSLAGSADVQADKGSGDNFDVRVAGSGNLLLASLDTRAANVSISGSGDVKVAGRCGALNVKIAGSGDADLAGLACTNTAISIAGSGDVTAHASGQADVRIAGSGDVRITGGAKCSKKVAGSGEVYCS